MKSLFENITDNEFKTLDDILHNPDSTPMTFFINDPTIDGRIRELEKAELISIQSGKLNITELGRAALVEHDKSIKRQVFIEEQRQEELSALKALAESAMKQADIAEKDAISAKRDATFSKVISIIAIIISIVAIIVPLLSS